MGNNTFVIFGDLYTMGDEGKGKIIDVFISSKAEYVVWVSKLGTTRGHTVVMK